MLKTMAQMHPNHAINSVH